MASLLPACQSRPAHADLVFSTYSGETVTPGNSNFTLATEFSVGPLPISVSRLGVYDDGGDGLPAARAVDIWITTGYLGGSAIVPSGTAGSLVADWRFVSVVPFTLAANTTYRIGGHTGSPPERISLGVSISVTV